MKSIRIEVAPVKDQQEQWEEFTWDLVPIVPAEKTLHLQNNGLPKTGGYVPAGGILVGKIGKTTAFRPGKMPSSLEMHGLEFDVLKSKFGSMWYDASFYANHDNAGLVIEAHFEPKDDCPVAVVLLDSRLPDGKLIPPLKPLHPDCSLSKAKMEKYAKDTTAEIIESLKPGQQGSLKTRPDGTMIDGHHRIKILRDRGVDVDALPREVIAKKDEGSP
jgi:hypothetical protein